MKITWFGNTTFRLCVGGGIVVVDPEGAPGYVERHEVASGADFVVPLVASSQGNRLETLDLQNWRPRLAARLIDADEESNPSVRPCRIAEAAVLVEAEGEALAVVEPDRADVEWGRWIDEIVIVLTGEPELCMQATRAALAAGRPRLICLALPEADPEDVLSQLAGELDSVSLQALEPGLAVEV